ALFLDVGHPKFPRTCRTSKCEHAAEAGHEASAPQAAVVPGHVDLSGGQSGCIIRSPSGRCHHRKRPGRHTVNWDAIPWTWELTAVCIGRASPTILPQNSNCFVGPAWTKQLPGSAKPFSRLQQYYRNRPPLDRPRWHRAPGGMPGRVPMQYNHAVSATSPVQPRAAANDTTDEALVVQIARRDKRALQALYARHHVRVYRFALRFLNDEAAAEDTVSEVFIDVWRQAERFEGRSQVTTWLLAIARNKALSLLRRRSAEELDDEV